MKRVTAILGSPRRRGLTYTATQQFLVNLSSYGDVQSELVFLDDFNVESCRGCKACFLRGEENCPLKDERDVLIGKIRQSDGVIFASPNYSFQVSGLMKTFLDRLGFFFHRPQFFGKTFTCIVAQGIFGGGNIVKYLGFVGNGLGFNVVKGSCITSLEPIGPKEHRKMENALAKHSRRFHTQLMRPDCERPSMLQLMGFRLGRTSVKLRLCEKDRDYTYYRDHGWFDSDYFYPTRLGPFKKLAGIAFDWLGKRIYGDRDDACSSGA